VRALVAVIRIGINTLAFCFEISDDNNPHDDKAMDFRSSRQSLYFDNRGAGGSVAH
jgi:hypothetical protein